MNMTDQNATLYCGKDIDDMSVEELREALKEAATLLDAAYRRAQERGRLYARIASRALSS